MRAATPCVIPASEVRTYYFPYDEYMGGKGKQYEEWGAGLFQALADEPLFKDKVRFVYTRGVGDNAIESTNMSSGLVRNQNTSVEGWGKPLPTS